MGESKGSSIESELAEKKLCISAVTLDTFVACIGERFVVSLADQQIELELVEAVASDRDNGKEYPFRKGFSLLFRGAKDCFLDAGIRELHNATLGDVELHMGAVQPSPKYAIESTDSYFYESVFA